MMGLATGQGAPHGACDDATDGEDDGRRQHDPAAPLHVRHKEEKINQEGEKAEEEGWQDEDQ